MKIIRSTRHSLDLANHDKLVDLDIFIDQYRFVVQSMIDDIWDNGYEYKSHIFDLQNNLLDIRSFLPASFTKKWDGDFSARMLTNCCQQALGMLKSATEKRRKQLFMLDKLRGEGKDTTNLERKIAKFPLVRPNASQIQPSLNDKVIDSSTESSFDLFVRIRINKYRHIKLPIQLHKIDRKWAKKGELKNFIRISESELSLAYSCERAKNSGNKIVGADQGYKTVLSLSDNQVTDTDLHGHTLASICEKIARKQPGSKGFRKAVDHRTNFINRSLNRLDFTDIKEVRLEKVINIRRNKKQYFKPLIHWTYTQIKQKLIALSETEGFRFREVDNQFRSQRCSSCGLVLKSNRKGKQYKCICGFTGDADINAAKNLAIDLFPLPFNFRSKRLNRKGFYWKHDGVFLSEEPGVPCTN